MKFIIIDNKSGRQRSFSGNSFFFCISLALFLAVPSAIGYFAYRLGVGEAELNGETVASWRAVLEQQQGVVQKVKWEAEHNLEATALRVAQLQARIVRLDALGDRLTKIGRLQEGEFDFSQDPAMGGPLDSAEVSGFRMPSYLDALNELSRDIEDREQQLSVLETFLVDRKMQRDIFLAGRPVKKGWMSSRYGLRVDPITGKRAMHYGVDFAGRIGADVVAVAAGVVVYAGKKSGYGEMVEINHGGGYSTRYGHHKELMVKVGDIVRKGEVVGFMGSSGRSTGPHVHFEVYKNGQVVDPSTYIQRASR